MDRQSHWTLWMTLWSRSEARTVRIRGRTRVVLTTTLCCALFTVAGCGEVGSHPDETDTPSLEVVADIGEAPRWLFSEEPILSLGEDGGDGPTFYSIRDVRFGEDSTIYVLDGGSVAVQVFSAEGRFVRTIGRRGDGPGEFQNPFELYVTDSEMVVWDTQVRRLTRFDLEGEVIGTQSAATSLLQGARLAGLFPDGSFLAMHTRLRTPDRGERTTMGWVIVTTHRIDGTLLDTMGTYPGEPMAWFGERSVIPQLFGAHTWVASNGVVTWILSGESGAATKLVPPDPPRSFSWDPGDLVVTDDEIARYEADRQGDGSITIRGRSIDVGEQLSLASESFPAADRLVVDRQGRLWIRRFRRPSFEGSNEWLLFDPDRQFVATVAIPADVMVRDAIGDWVLATRRDSLGVQTVVVHHLDSTGLLF